MPHVNDGYDYQRIILYSRVSLKQIERETGIDYRTLQNYKARPWTAKWTAVQAIIGTLLRHQQITQSEIMHLLNSRR